MSISPKTYAQIGEALYNRDWVYLMRELLDIRKPVAEQIAYHAAHGLPYEMPPIDIAILRKRLDAKVAECADALIALEEAEGRLSQSPEGLPSPEPSAQA